MLSNRKYTFYVTYHSIETVTLAMYEIHKQKFKCEKRIVTICKLDNIDK